INDLNRAIALRDWRDDDPDDKIAAADKVTRIEVGRRFAFAVREVLQHGDSASRLAVMDMLLKMAPSTRGLNTRTSFTRIFATDLVELIRGDDDIAWEAATRALGQINPEPELAVPVLSEQLMSMDKKQKLAAADGLVHLIRVASHIVTHNQGPNMV